MGDIGIQPQAFYLGDLRQGVNWYSSSLDMLRGNGKRHYNHCTIPARDSKHQVLTDKAVTKISIDQSRTDYKKVCDSMPYAGIRESGSAGSARS